MAEKPDTGETLPSLTLDLAGGGRLTMPDDLDAKYMVIPFHRSHW